MEDNDELSITKILQEQEAIKEEPLLLDTITAVFEFTQYLLDDDDNLTKSANLNSKAKKKLNARIEELYLNLEEEP